MVPSCAAPVGVLPLATVSGCHSDRHEALPPGIIELVVHMKRPPCSADSVYRVMPLWFTSTLVPSFELFTVCTVVLAAPAPPPPPLLPAADIEPQPAANATAATSPTIAPIRTFMISPRCRMCCRSHPKYGAGGAEGLCGSMQTVYGRRTYLRVRAQPSQERGLLRLPQPGPERHDLREPVLPDLQVRARVHLQWPRRVPFRPGTERQPRRGHRDQPDQSRDHGVDHRPAIPAPAGTTPVASRMATNAPTYSVRPAARPGSVTTK